MASLKKEFKVPGKTDKEIYDAVASDIERFLSKTPMGQAQISREQAELKVGFKGTLASGTLSAKDGLLIVDISLSMLASAFKGKIEEGVTRWLEKTFQIKQS